MVLRTVMMSSALGYRLFQSLDAGLTFIFTPLAPIGGATPTFDFLIIVEASMSVFSDFKYSLLWIETTLLGQAGVYLH